MTAAEYVTDCQRGCGSAAEDCKRSADYAAYNFRNGHEDEARRYVKNLEENLSRLKGELSSLDYAHRKVAEEAKL
jgi:hypothetical protein